jgi:ABC-type Fe3+-hydroxamate transport system substrate-binding protein
LRIVSLVPSLTESCFAFGLGAQVVGVTDWCVHPAESVAALPKLGGTKDPDIAAIAALAPDLVIANHEENTRRVVEDLESRGLRVWLTYPRTVAGAVEVLRQLAAFSPDRVRADAALGSVIEAFEGARSAAPPCPRPRVFCPIWRDPWMAVGGDTYAADLIQLCGGASVFADRGARGARADRRYPIVTLDEIVQARPEVILLPDEPYAFGPDDEAELSALDLPAARSGRIHRIDGTWASWYGPRIAPAIHALRSLLAIPPN